MINFDDIELIIFDCDGVLVDSESLSNEVLAVHATAFGWPMTAAESQGHFKGMTMRQIHELFEKREGRSLNDAWIEKYYQDSFAAFETGLRAVAGVEDLIKRAQSRGLKICVASQGPKRKMQLTLGVTGLWDYFAGNVFSAHDVARPKPYPDLFLHAAETMNVDPSQCCVIEDSPSGLKAADAAGMRVIYYDAGGADKDAEPTSEYVRFSSMDEVLPV